MANKQLKRKIQKVSASKFKKAVAYLNQLTSEVTLNDLIAYLSSPLDTTQLMIADEIVSGITAGAEKVEMIQRPKLARATPPLAAAMHLFHHCQYLAYQHAGVIE